MVAAWLAGCRFLLRRIAYLLGQFCLQERTLTCWLFRWLLGKNKDGNYQPFHGDKSVLPIRQAPLLFTDRRVKLCRSGP